MTFKDPVDQMASDPEERPCYDGRTILTELPCVVVTSVSPKVNFGPVSIKSTLIVPLSAKRIHSMLETTPESSQNSSNYDPSSKSEDPRVL